MALPTTIRIAAAAVLDREGRLLVVRKRGTYAFMQPGGKIEPDDWPVPMRYRLRELREELGMAIDNPAIRSTSGASRRRLPIEPRRRYVVADLFELVIALDPVPAGEIEEIVWMSPEAPAGLTLAPLTRDVVLPRYRLCGSSRRSLALSHPGKRGVESVSGLVQWQDGAKFRCRSTLDEVITSCSLAMAPITPN